MKTERVKTPETTEEVSSHPGKTGLGSTKRHRNTSRAAENAMVDLEKGLVNL
jgi:hypothetical protein